MKLTTSIRSAFVRAVMDDVPQADFQTQAMAMLTEDAVKQLPPKVRAIYDNKDLRHFVATKQVYGVLQYVYVPGPEYKMSDAARQGLTDMNDSNAAQLVRREELRAKIQACAYACSTRKQLVEMLPEFEKYLPADAAAASRALPVVANVVADFMKAGWPKGAKGDAPAKAARHAGK